MTTKDNNHIVTHSTQSLSHVVQSCRKLSSKHNLCFKTSAHAVFRQCTQDTGETAHKNPSECTQNFFRRHTKIRHSAHGRKHDRSTYSSPPPDCKFQTRKQKNLQRRYSVFQKKQISLKNIQKIFCRTTKIYEICAV